MGAKMPRGQQEQGSGLGKPHALVERVGRWRYAVKIVDGITATVDPWLRWGYGKAVRKGKRELKRYLRRKTLRSQKERIDLDD